MHPSLITAAAVAFLTCASTVQAAEIDIQLLRQLQETIRYQQ
jgi:hypothetical protein